MPGRFALQLDGRLAGTRVCVESGPGDHLRTVKFNGASGNDDALGAGSELRVLCGRAEQGDDRAMLVPMCGASDHEHALHIDRLCGKRKIPTVGEFQSARNGDLAHSRRRGIEQHVPTCRDQDVCACSGQLPVGPCSRIRPTVDAVVYGAQIAAYTVRVFFTGRECPFTRCTGGRAHEKQQGRTQQKHGRRIARKVSGQDARCLLSSIVNGFLRRMATAQTQRARCGSLNARVRPACDGRATLVLSIVMFPASV